LEFVLPQDRDRGTPSKYHLVLQWVHNADTQELTCKINSNLKYYAHSGGEQGYTKIYFGETTKLTPQNWETDEKFWLSDTFGITLGYFQPDGEREAIEPRTGMLENRKNGLGRYGEYLDHMGRSQRQLNGGDMADIVNDNNFQAPGGESPAPLFQTPDNGLTIYKTLPTTNTFYNNRHNKDHFEQDGSWQMVPQPCMMQPYSFGRILSNYDEMRIAGCPEDIIKTCQAGLWESPPYPELQKNYVYSTVNTIPITKDNVNDLWDGNEPE
jgi:hypothetical protein